MHKSAGRRSVVCVCVSVCLLSIVSGSASKYRLIASVICQYFGVSSRVAQVVEVILVCCRTSSAMVAHIHFRAFRQLRFRTVLWKLHQLRKWKCWNNSQQTTYNCLMSCVLDAWIARVQNAQHQPRKTPLLSASVLRAFGAQHTARFRERASRRGLQSAARLCDSALAAPRPVRSV